MLLSIPLSLPQHTHPPPQFPSRGVRQEPPCQTLPLVPISTVPPTTTMPRPLQGAYGHAHPLQVPPLYAHRPQGSHLRPRPSPLRPRPHGALFWSSEATPLFPPSTALSPQTTAPATPPSPAAPPTHSEAPSLVGDGPSAMAGLMVSAGRTGFLRASIGAPRPAAALQPGPIGGGATRARGCGLGRRAAEGGRARGSGLSGPPPRPSEADAAPQPGGRGTGGGHEIAGRVLARSSPPPREAPPSIKVHACCGAPALAGERADAGLRLSTCDRPAPTLDCACVAGTGRGYER